MLRWACTTTTKSCKRFLLPPSKYPPTTLGVNRAALKRNLFKNCWLNLNSNISKSQFAQSSSCLITCRRLSRRYQYLHGSVQVARDLATVQVFPSSRQHLTAGNHWLA